MRIFCVFLFDVQYSKHCFLLENNRTKLRVIVVLGEISIKALAKCIDPLQHVRTKGLIEGDHLVAWKNNNKNQLTTVKSIAREV